MTTPTLLPPAELAAIREQDKSAVGLHDRCRLADHVPRLLAYIDAITAPVPEDGGEALAIEAWHTYRVERAFLGSGCAAWEDLGENERAAHRCAFIALYQRGHAAGVASAAPPVACDRLDAWRAYALAVNVLRISEGCVEEEEYARLQEEHARAWKAVLAVEPEAANR